MRAPCTTNGDGLCEEDSREVNGMRIKILGGAGAVGKGVARDLLRSLLVGGWSLRT